MSRLRRVQIRIALLLALLIPLTSSGHGFAVNLVSLARQCAPPGGQVPAQTQHEEDETQSSAGVEVPKLPGRKRGRTMFTLRFSSLPALSIIESEQSPLSWTVSRDVVHPITTYLDTALARRGPPTA